MGAMTAEEWRELGEAIVVWCRMDVVEPRRFSADRLSSRFGTDCVARLLPQLEGFANEFYKSDAWLRPTLSPLEQQRAAEQEFAERYPDMPLEAVRALGQNYAFDYK
jgi:hypothetical protein